MRFLVTGGAGSLTATDDLARAVLTAAAGAFSRQVERLEKSEHGRTLAAVRPRGRRAPAVSPAICPAGLIEVPVAVHNACDGS